MNIRELNRNFRERLTPALRARRSRQRRLELLGDVDAFRKCTPDELRAIDALGTQVDVPAGQVLVSEGEPGSEFIVILDGRAVVTRGDGEVAIVGPGAFVGEAALLRDIPRNATVTTISRMRMIVFNRSEFSSLRQRAPHAEAAIAVTALQRA